MYLGETMKLESYDIKLNELIERASAPVIGEIKGICKENIYGDDEPEQGETLSKAEEKVMNKEFNL